MQSKEGNAFGNYGMECHISALVLSKCSLLYEHFGCMGLMRLQKLERLPNVMLRRAAKFHKCDILFAIAVGITSELRETVQGFLRAL